MIYPLRFTCPQLPAGTRFPAALTGRGQDLSPEFVLHDLSPECETLAVTLEDLSHPIKNFTHWVLWNFPAADRIPGGLPPGRVLPQYGNARQGLGYGYHRYAGPKPPRGKTHVYRFTVYALSGALSLSSCTAKRRFLKHAEGHILQKGTLTAEFE